MVQPRVIRAGHLALSIVGLIACARAADEPAGLQTIDDPGGGHVVYGPVDQPSPAAAMALVLHLVHTRYGVAPVVGKAFQSRDGREFGAFFNLNARTPVAGLALVFTARGTKPAAAVLFDDAGRFAKTEPVLMRALTAAWRRAAAPDAAAAGAPATAGAVPALTSTRFPDGSGAVDLPAGWRITFASHGAAKIAGPRGEAVLLGNSVGPIYDPADAQVQSRLRYANRANPPILCASGDALRTYLCVLQRGGAAPVFALKKSRPIPARGMAAQAVLIDADLDLHDGRGLLSCELGLSITATSRLGTRTLGINGTCAPQSSAAQEQPTLKAIFDSYRINGQVVAQEFAGDERRSRQAGANARTQANAAHATEDARSAAFQAHLDDIDRSSKSFQNYQLDQTELQDSLHGARGAVPNALADALIKANPDRFQAVAAPDFLKGADF
jgi:hypothetical protein